jgi:hypothetical protein
LIRIAVIFVNYGPYHVARARAVARLRGIDPYFVELAALQELYSWVADKRVLEDRLVTVFDCPYEELSSRTGSAANYWPFWSNSRRG